MSQSLDGWLVYDYRGHNPHACRLLKLSNRSHGRRLFVWIPAKGEKVIIPHFIEENTVEHLKGKIQSYRSFQELEAILKKILRPKMRIAMEYSPLCALPTLSFVDGGTLEWIRSFGVVVVSSAPLLTSALTPTEQKSHRFAARQLQEVVALAFQRAKGQTERSLAKWIQLELKKRGCIADLPIVAVGPHSAIPHHVSSNRTIKKGDFLLIDLWCKEKKPGSIYADICRVGLIERRPSKREIEVFDTVRDAQRAAIDLLRKHKHLTGKQVDEEARAVIIRSGFGQYFTHRLGHNISQDLHGLGTNLDSFETVDSRELLPNTCFSVEPGIYLPGEFGVRLETDVLLDGKGKVHITGGIQEHFLD